MNIIHRFRAAVEAFREPQRARPSTEEITKTTNSVLALFQKRDKNLTPRTREQMRRNPYIYSALRNTADELAGKWNGASGYTPRDASEEHLRRPPQILTASDLSLHQQQVVQLRWNIDTRLKRNWDDVIKQILFGRADGKSVNEIKWAWQPSGPYKGSWVIDDILSCDPDCFSFRYKKVENELTGEVEYKRELLYSPYGGSGGFPVPEGKFLVYSFDRKYENDEGESILNKLDLFDWYQRNNFIFWMVDLNRYGSPLVVGKVPRTAKQTQRDALLAAIDSIQQETGIVISEDERLELLQAMRNGTPGFELLNQIINRIISVVITGHSMSMEEGRTGSYSYAKTTTSEIRLILLYALATAIDGIINRQLIPWWMTYNYPGTLEYPRQQILPPRAEEVANPESPSPGDTSVSVPALSFAEHKKDAVDILTENAVSQSLSIFENTWITPIIGAIRKSETPAEVQQAIEDFEADIEEYADLLQRSFITSHVLGRWQVFQKIRKPAQFKAGLSDDEIRRLLQSPVVVEKARDIILSKELMAKRDFNRLDDAAKRRAFTLAGQEDLRIMGLIREAIADAIQEQATIKDIEKAAFDAFHKYGVTWQTPYHAETVFRTNIESALNDGFWQMLHEPQVRSEIAYLQYMTQDDARVRPSHRKMHGIIRPIDDPIWQIWWPPNGYNCRCYMKFITKEEAERRGIQPTPVIPNVVPDSGFISGPEQWNFTDYGNSIFSTFRSLF